MKRLFLTSYLAGVKTLVRRWLAEQGIREILFVPTAARVEAYTDYVEEAAEAFMEMGTSIKRMDIAEMEREAVLQEMEDGKCLYFSGGNTFYLLQELRRKDLVEYFQRKVEEGMPYIGESAGAMIASQDIDCNRLMDDCSAAPELTDYSALGVVDFHVVPHHGEEPFVESAAEILRVYGAERPLVPLSNHEAVIVQDDRYSVEREP